MAIKELKKNIKFKPQPIQPPVEEKVKKFISKGGDLQLTWKKTQVTIVLL